jgi:hypothetical protein
LILVLFIIALTLVACKSESDQNVTGNDKGTVEILGLGKNLTQSFDCYIYDGLEYIGISDFVSLCNLMNDELQFLTEVQVKDYDRQNNTLKIVFRRDSHFTRDVISNFISESFNYESSEIEGFDFTKIVNFNEDPLKVITINGEEYLPLEAIRNHIFNDDLYLLSVGDSKYEFLKDSVTEIILNNEYERLPVPKTELFNKSLNQLLTMEALALEIEPISDYTAYYFEVQKIIDLRNDYHSNVFNLAELSKETLEKLGYDAFLLESNRLKFHNLFSKATSTEIDWFNLSKNTIYIDIDGFFMDPYKFSNKINRLNVYLSKNQEIHDVILDLRDNSGGYTANAIKVLRTLSGKNLMFSIGYKVDNTLYSKQVYKLENSKKKIATYNITLLLNESSASAAIVLANLLKDNANIKVMGTEPQFKQTSEVSFYQLFDGTLISQSSKSWCFLTSDGTEFNQVKLVDTMMNESEINTFLESFDIDK